jgi:hypothetical protein
MFSPGKKANLPNVPSTTPKTLTGTNTKIILFAFAFVLFVVIIGFTIYTIVNSKKDAKWPYSVNNCPDYWIEREIENEDGSTINACINTKDLGTCDNNLYYNMDTMEYPNNDGTYIKFNSGPVADQSKCRWAKSCDLTWDGITNKSSMC